MLFVADSQALTKRAELLMKTERFEEAVRDYEALKELDPSNRGAWRCFVMHVHGLCCGVWTCCGLRATDNRLYCSMCGTPSDGQRFGAR